MQLTTEQIAITDEVKHIVSGESSTNLIKVNAVSGSGKTSTLKAIADIAEPTHGLYLAFNKSIATEAKAKFNSNIECRTVHSLAYAYVVKGTKRTIEPFTYRSIKEKVTYETKEDILSLLKEFFASDATDLSWFDDYPPKLATPCKRYVNLMAEDKIPVSFDFILKIFHIYLHIGEISLPHYDLLMLDEAGDTTGVILEIFRLANAHLKVMVGDNNQNIYEFMHTINGFEKLKDEGKLFPLSQSFRVSPEIAKRVEKFCHTHLDPTLVFKGTESPPPQSPTKAYIARTNSTLIERMIHLNSRRTPYSLLRKASEIFELPLVLIFLPKGKPVKSEYSHIKAAYDLWNREPLLQDEYPSHIRFLAKELAHDRPLQTAIRLLTKHSYKVIFDTYAIAKALPNTPQPITLCTSHSSKGLEFDEVYIENDMNTAVAAGIEQSIPLELRLGYVACTRCKHSLLNCEFL